MTIPAPPWRPAKVRQHRRRPLTQERIVDVALDLLRREGYDNVSMRRLAQELGTGPASLYAHVENKRELDQLIVDRVIDPQMIPDPDPEHWQEQLKELMWSMRAMYQSNPGVARATMAMIPLGPSGIVAIERMLALLKAGGVPDQVNAFACDLIPLYVCAVSYESALWEEGHSASVPHEVSRDQIRDYLHSLPGDQFPTVVALADALTMGDGQGNERFRFGVEVIVSGIAALAGQVPRSGEAPKTT